MASALPFVDRERELEILRYKYSLLASGRL